MRRRDRRNRGLRGPLAPSAVPAMRSRTQQFDDTVAASWDQLAARNTELQYVELAIAEVPRDDESGLAAFDPADAGVPARVTVFRRPIELRAASRAGLQRLAADVLAEQASGLIGVPPSVLDPDYAGE